MGSSASREAPAPVAKRTRYLPAVEAALPDLTGKIVLVTGAARGIGLDFCKICARKGATVVLGCRDRAKAKPAAQEIGPKAVVPEAALDLLSFASVRAFADEVGATHEGKLTHLVNNAGIMALPPESTADGHDIQMQTNLLSPYLLTALLAPKMAPGGRVVWLSSGPGIMGIRSVFGEEALASGVFAPGCATSPDVPLKPKAYWETYMCTKLGNNRLAAEFKRRASGSSLGLTTTTVNPGITNTELWPRAVAQGSSRFMLMTVLQRFLGHSPADGAAILAHGAFVAPDGAFCEPKGPVGFSGPPHVSGDSGEQLQRSNEGKRLHLGAELDAKLWDACAKATRATLLF